MKIEEWLHKNEVMSFSPETGMILLRVAKDVKRAMIQSPPADNKIKEELENYHNALIVSATVTGQYQELIIKTFQNIIKKESE